LCTVDFHQQVVRTRLGIFDKDVVIPIVVEEAGIEQLEFRLILAAAAVFFDELTVRKLALWVLVQHLQVRVRRRRIDIVVEFFRVLAVISFAIREAENALFQNGIVSVPERERQAQALLVVANPGDTILSPAISATACVSCGK